VPEVTEASTILSLSLAHERFSGKALVVEGSDEFKLLVAKLSALEGVSTHLADPVLEKDRRCHVRANELAQQSLKDERDKQSKKDFKPPSTSIEDGEDLQLRFNAI